jgi:hypothetical protein
MPNKSAFLSMGRIALFKELRAGQPAPAYTLDKYDYNVLIPKEMLPLIADPDISQNMLFFVRRPPLATMSDRIPGIFKFHVSSRSGYDFHCEYNPTSKVFDKIQVWYEAEHDFLIRGLTIQQFMDLYHMGPVEVIRYLLGTPQPEGKRLQLESFLT